MFKSIARTHEAPLFIVTAAFRKPRPFSHIFDTTLARSPPPIINPRHANPARSLVASSKLRDPACYLISLTHSYTVIRNDRSRDLVDFPPFPTIFHNFITATRKFDRSLHSHACTVLRGGCENENSSAALLTRKSKTEIFLPGFLDVAVNHFIPGIISKAANPGARSARGEMAQRRR